MIEYSCLRWGKSTPAHTVYTGQFQEEIIILAELLSVLQKRVLMIYAYDNIQKAGWSVTDIMLIFTT